MLFMFIGILFYLCSQSLLVLLFLIWLFEMTNLSFFFILLQLAASVNEYVNLKELLAATIVMMNAKSSKSVSFLENVDKGVKKEIEKSPCQVSLFLLYFVLFAKNVNCQTQTILRVTLFSI